MIKNPNMRSGVSRIYLLSFTIIVFIFALLPFFFYLSKATKNPSEFRPQEKRYKMVEVKVSDIEPAVLFLVKPGDIQKDCNGEESARIISILKVQPNIAGKILLSNGERAEFISDDKDLYLLLKVRYDKVGDVTVLRATDIQVKVGNRINLRFEDYFLFGVIVKTYSDDLPK